jgi:2-dehydro-3-deoxyphosphogluconate aldolase/(4S)-4-hydroxy-2-oxoglutarate aldolase
VAAGAFTPTEALRAYEAGVEFVKVFPASTGGPDHVRALRGPLSQIPLIPTGGVSLENAQEYFDAGATALGVGSSIVDLDAARRDDLETIRDNAAAFTGIVAKTR